MTNIELSPDCLLRGFISGSSKEPLLLEDEVVFQLARLGHSYSYLKSTCPPPNLQTIHTIINQLAEEFITTTFDYAKIYMQQRHSTVMKVGDAYNAVEYFARVYVKKPAFYIDSIDGWSEGVITYDDDIIDDDYDNEHSTDDGCMSDEDCTMDDDDNTSGALEYHTESEDCSSVIYSKDEHEIFCYDNAEDDIFEEKKDGSAKDSCRYFGKNLDLFENIFPSHYSPRYNSDFDLSDKTFRGIIEKHCFFYAPVPYPTIRFLKATMYSFIINVLKEWSFQIPANMTHTAMLQNVCGKNREHQYEKDEMRHSKKRRFEKR